MGGLGVSSCLRRRTFQWHDAPSSVSLLKTLLLLLPLALQVACVHPDPDRRPTAAEIVQLLMQLPPSQRAPPPPPSLLPQGSGPLTPPRISRADEPAPDTPGPGGQSAATQWGSPERLGPPATGLVGAGQATDGGGGGGALGRASSLPPLAPSHGKTLERSSSSRLTAAGSVLSEWSEALLLSRAGTLSGAASALPDVALPVDAAAAEGRAGEVRPAAAGAAEENAAAYCVAVAVAQPVAAASIAAGQPAAVPGKDAGGL